MLLALVAGCADPPPAPAATLDRLAWPSVSPNAVVPPPPLYGRILVDSGGGNVPIMLEGAAGSFDRASTGGFPCTWFASAATSPDLRNGPNYQWIFACRLGPTEDVVLQAICPGLPGTNRAGPVLLRSPLAPELVSIELTCGQHRDN